MQRVDRPEVVVVTGASAGVGRATVREFARRGARLGLIARGLMRLEDARQEVESLGGQALVLPADVAHAEQVEDAASTIEAAFGPIDIWINNAMVSVFSPVGEMTAADFRRVTDVTYLGVVHGTLAALHRMKPRDCGCIIQVGSVLAYRSIPLQSAYCAAKHAVVGFTDSLRSELKHDRSRVRVTAVNLPAMNTPQFDWVKSRLPNRPQPVPPIFEPELAARAIYWAAHHERRELDVGWPAVKAVIGQRVAPGLLDSYLAHRAFGAQQTDQREDPGRPDNLWRPVPGDYEAHGRFSGRAHDRSALLWVSMHRALVAAGLAGLVFGSLALAAHRPWR